MGSPMNPCRPWKLWTEPMGRDPCRPWKLWTEPMGRDPCLLSRALLLLPLWRGHSERRGLA